MPETGTHSLPLPEHPELAGKRLYLFASNAQPLYAQNMLNAICAPPGHVLTARYGGEWLNPLARRHWGGGMTGLPVLLHFCLLHTSQYFEPAYFPLRRGQVVDAERSGDFFFLRVVLQDDLSLRWRPEEVEPPLRDSQAFLPALDAYRETLRAAEIQRPYDGSATVDDDLLAGAADVLELDDDPADHFRRNAEFLSRTESFAAARFLRVLKLVETGSGDEVPYAVAGDGRPRFELKGGGAYELLLFSYQPAGVSKAVDFSATVGDEAAVRIVGSGRVPIAARFDRPRLTLQAGRPGGGQELTTSLAIEPPEGEMGPRIDLLLAVTASPRDKALNLAGPAAVLLPLAGATIVTATLPKLLLALIALTAAVALQWFGVSVSGLMGPTAGAVKPSPPAR